MKLQAQIVDKKSNAMIVFVHGNSSSSLDFESVISILEHNSMTVDLPGHGQTGKSESAADDYSVEGLRRQLTEALMQIKNPFILVGHSLGGHLCIEIASKLQQCKALVVIGAPPLKKPLNLEEAFTGSEALQVYFKADNLKDEIDKALSQMLFMSGSKKMLTSAFVETDPEFRQILAETGIQKGQLLDEKRIVENIRIPVYAINGLQDPSVNLDYIRSISSFSKSYEVAKCGHFPHLEQPIRTKEILDEIVEDITTP